MALLHKHEGLITAEDFARLPDPGPCELVQGRIIHLSPAQPLHGYYEGTIGIPLGNYARASGRSRVLFGEAGLWTRRVVPTSCSSRRSDGLAGTLKASSMSHPSWSSRFSPRTTGRAR